MKIFDEHMELMRFGHDISLIGAVYTDEQKKEMRMLLFPGEGANCADMSLGPLLEPDTEEWNKLFDQTDTLNVEVFEKDENGKLIKVIVRKSQRNIAQEINWEVFRRDEYACRYCGNDKTPLTVDHLVLWEEGGPSTLANMTTACKKCNRTRGNQKFIDWLQNPYYKKVSANLTPEQRAANAALVGTLDRIPRTINQRSKRS